MGLVLVLAGAPLRVRPRERPLLLRVDLADCSALVEAAIKSAYGRVGLLMLTATDGSYTPVNFPR